MSVDDESVIDDADLSEWYDTPIYKQMYVAWSDVMGIRQTALYDMRVSRYRVLQFHALVMISRETVGAVEIAVAGDGVFIASESYQQIQDFLCDLHRRVFVSCINKVIKGAPHLPFLIRSAVTWGNVALGSLEIGRFKKSGIPVDEHYLKHVMAGTAVVDAYGTESGSTPMGIRLSKQAIDKLGDNRTDYIAWAEDWNEVLTKLIEPYYQRLSVDYPDALDPDKISQHLAMARRYPLS